MTDFRLIIAVTALALCLSMGAEAQAGAKLKMVEDGYDFGCLGIDYTVFHVFKITNDGDSDLKIDSLFATCDCSSVKFRDSILVPGDTGSFRLKFNTKDYYGPTSRTVRIVSNDSDQPVHLVKYTSIVGQWPYGVKPDPIALFFLPAHKSLKATLESPILDWLELMDVTPHDDLVEVDVSSRRVGKGGKIVLDVRPNTDLPGGTHHTNFRVRFKTPDGTPPLVITFPVKIVRY